MSGFESFCDYLSSKLIDISHVKTGENQDDFRQRELVDVEVENLRSKLKESEAKYTRQIQELENLTVDL